MKLAKLISIQYTAISSLILLAGGILFYFFIQASLKSAAETALRTEKQAILLNIQETGEIPKSNYLADITPIYEEEILPDFFEHAAINKEGYTGTRHFLNFIFCCNAKGGYYSVTLQHSLLGASSLIRSVVLSMIFIFVLLGVGLAVANVQLLNRNMMPFSKTLESIQAYDVRTNPDVVFVNTRIEEMQELNTQLNSFINKINVDYKNLKEYNENISHEIQTPLAVIRGKIEQILNSPDLSERNVELIGAAYSNAIELSKIIRGLTLISKIDNLEFKKEEVVLKDLVDKTMVKFEDFYQMKNIKTFVRIDPTYTIQINAELADVLMNNIFKNALNHNVEDGMFEVRQEQTQIMFMNTSPKSSETKFDFKRFKTQSLDVSSTGIGVSIVKKICDTHGFNLDYYSKNKMHIMAIEF